MTYPARRYCSIVCLLLIGLGNSILLFAPVSAFVATLRIATIAICCILIPMQVISLTEHYRKHRK